MGLNQHTLIYDICNNFKYCEFLQKPAAKPAGEEESTAGRPKDASRGNAFSESKYLRIYYLYNILA